MIQAAADRKPMNDESPVNAPKGADAARSLTRVLDQNEHVKNLVEESAQELMTLNAVLKQDMRAQVPQAELQQAVDKSQAVEKKVLDASAKLSVINVALGDQVNDRLALENQLATITEAEGAARYASFHDSLTGLPNRALFIDRLKHGLTQARRHNWTAAIMFMDLDSFKAINDSHGHDVGDFVLQTIANRLRESTRGDDTVSRHGGDEFLYLLMGIRDEQDITPIAEKIIRAIKAPFEFNEGGRRITLSITPSIGISVYPKNGSDANELVRHADKAMYQAKRSRSGYSFAP